MFLHYAIGLILGIIVRLHNSQSMDNISANMGLYCCRPGYSTSPFTS